MEQIYYRYVYVGAKPEERRSYQKFCETEQNGVPWCESWWTFPKRRTGGRETQAEPIHTPKITPSIRRGVVLPEYLSGDVIAECLSTLMPHKLRMEAVQQRTSAGIKE
jgi:hypothetical protein